MKETFWRLGHVTVPGVFAEARMDAVVADIGAWGEEVLGSLGKEDRRWYIDGGVKTATVLRKLDNPVLHRASVRALAQDSRLVGLAEGLIGNGVTVFFSQIFMKPPQGGGPKPVHQDNYYFGPEDRNGMVTAWIALDDADIANGCMSFGEGTNKGPVYDHVAPPGEPFNLRVPPDVATKVEMLPAPVPKGGVSFHHGNTFHQSADNFSPRWRRAAAIHYLRNDNRLLRPALPYDAGAFLRIT